MLKYKLYYIFIKTFNIFILEIYQKICFLFIYFFNYLFHLSLHFSGSSDERLIGNCIFYFIFLHHN